MPTCFAGTPTCAADGAGLVSCGAGPDCSTSGMITLTDGSTTVLPGAQDQCTCNLVGGVNTCNRPSCTVVGNPTCPSGVAPICAGYDSNTAANLQIPVCSTRLPIPQDHLNNNIANLPALTACAAVNGAVPACITLAAPTCPTGGVAANAGCANGAITCDNVPGGQAPRCSVTPGVGSIPGTSLCTVGSVFHNCPSCNGVAAGLAPVCATGMLSCFNYHSSSTIIPAPVCRTALPTPNGAAPQCIDNVPTCLPVAAPMCNFGGVATTAGCPGGVGSFTCLGRNADEGPVCSLLPNAGNAANLLQDANACLNGAVKFLCGEVSNPVLPVCTGAGATPSCPLGTTLTCDGNSGVTAAALTPVCSWLDGAAAPAGGNVNAATCDTNANGATVRQCAAPA